MRTVYQVILWLSTHSTPKGSDPWGSWEPIATFYDFYEARDWASRNWINWEVRETAITWGIKHGITHHQHATN